MHTDKTMKTASATRTTGSRETSRLPPDPRFFLFGILSLMVTVNELSHLSLASDATSQFSEMLPPANVLSRQQQPEPRTQSHPSPRSLRLVKNQRELPDFG